MEPDGLQVDLTPTELAALASARLVAAPPPDLSLSEWSERNVKLSAEYAAQAAHFRCYPWQRGMLDAITDPRNHVVSCMKSARVGWTQLLLNMAGYHVDQDPCTIIHCQPTVEDAQDFSKEMLEPFIRDTACLIGKVNDAKSRDKASTILRKLYPGGQFVMVGANSARGFRRRAARKVQADEIDGYPPSAGQEGDQLSLLRKRTGTYWNWQMVIGSTPTVKGVSRIEEWYAQSDQRRYYVPCPHCAHMHPLEWGNLKWKPPYSQEDPCFVCPSCGKGFGYEHHHAIMERGEWRATAPFNGHAGFHIWAAYSYSPDCVWRELVKEWYRCKDNRLTLQTFVNTYLGETWEDEAERVDDTELSQRGENYDASRIPSGVLCITAGVDVQDDRLAVELVGWGRGHESWSLLWEEWYGEPATDELWQRLDELLAQTFNRADGATVPISACAIDSGGHHTQKVYAFAKPRVTRRVFAVKGVEGDGRPIASTPHRSGSADHTKLVLVGVNTAKSLLYSRLKLTEQGPQYCHFPIAHPPDYYSQLTAEQVRVKYKNNRPVRVWEKKSSSARNEALDCRVYAMAALELFRPRWDSLAARLTPTEQPEPAPADDEDDGNQPPPEPHKHHRHNRRHDEMVPDAASPLRNLRHRRGGGFVGGF